MKQKSKHSLSRRSFLATTSTLAAATAFGAADTDADKQQNRKPPVVFFTKHLGGWAMRNWRNRWRRWDTMVRI